MQQSLCHRGRGLVSHWRTHPKSKEPGKKRAAASASSDSVVKSALTAVSSPTYCTFTATSRPSASRALCTCHRPLDPQPLTLAILRGAASRHGSNGIKQHGYTRFSKRAQMHGAHLSAECTRVVEYIEDCTFREPRSLSACQDLEVTIHWTGTDSDLAQMVCSTSRHCVSVREREHRAPVPVKRPHAPQAQIPRRALRWAGRARAGWPAPHQHRASALPGPGAPPAP